ncbi:MAG: heme-binding protein, partial [Pseudomonadota bacterium]
VVDAGFDDSGGRAFRRLAGYIFGKNESRTQPGESEKMAMTVPVTRHQDAGDAGRTVYRFVMERAYSLETLPVPQAEGITLKEVPGGLTAVLRYRGGISEEGFKQQRAALEAALAEDGLKVIGPAMSATYNGPWTPGFLRRNEVLIPVAEDPETS